MRWNILLLTAFTNLAFASEWQPKSYEKVDLNNQNASEAVMFVLNTNKNHRPTYSISYLLDQRVIRTQPIPREIYEVMKAKLIKTVFKLSSKESGISCPSRILWKTGEVNNKKPAEQIDYCLNSTSEANFAGWYQEARRLLQL